MSSSLPSQVLKWSVAVLLAAELVGGGALFYSGPIYRYAINCRKAQQISCVLEQERPSGRKSWQVPLGERASATVQVKTLRRGGPQVLLYLNSDTGAVFAAQFVGGDEAANAQAAAERLNQAFSSAVPATVRVEAQAPSYTAWMIWVGYGVFVLLSLLIFRELFKRSSPAAFRNTGTS
ncbi:hypothetical protein E4K72_07895 [Oxalobacteraceae bacterium OM1]|nr:hypothetical protein E4K72_07895 [Oxalobacteraceae bacterium OM1]